MCRGGLCSPRTSVGALLRAQGLPVRVVVGCAHLEKNRVKISAQSELRISRNIRNRFWPDLRTRNRREQRGKSNLGGAPAPPPPWRPRTRGGTLLSSRGEAKEEEEGGGSLPSLSVAPERRRGKYHDGDLHQQLRRRHQQLSPPLCSGVTPLLPTAIST